MTALDHSILTPCYILLDDYLSIHAKILLLVVVPVIPISFMRKSS